jgi:predicted RNA binding protein YcfA (HicA-like mRNA interferase family)
MKLKEILFLIHQDGWYQIAQKGSHKQFKHPIKPGRITVPDHGLSKD